MLIQTQAKTGGLFCSATNGLLTSDFGSSTWIERHNSYNDNPANAQRIFWCLGSQFISADKYPKTQLFFKDRELNSLCHKGRELNCLLAWSNINFQLTLFQNPQILMTISSGLDLIHTPAPFSVWRFIMTMVIVISFARERKTAPNDYAPELLTWTVQIPNKLKDRI